jgi:cilia- and flagella-associated protein 57
MKNDIVERETTIKGKDDKIKDLYRKTQELEKFKFVLDYKIKELKREIGPRETLIQELNEQTTKMRQEEKFFSRMSSNLKLIQKDLSLKQDGLSITAQKLAGFI